MRRHTHIYTHTHIHTICNEPRKVPHPLEAISGFSPITKLHPNSLFNAVTRKAFLKSAVNSVNSLSRSVSEAPTFSFRTAIVVKTLTIYTALGVLVSQVLRK